jgi:aminoglycoside 3'-phosphotransferase I
VQCRRRVKHVAGLLCKPCTLSVPTGCIDVGRVGAADPNQDLAILRHNLAAIGEAAQLALWPAYGIQAPDIRKIPFHLCLDGFF